MVTAVVSNIICRKAECHAGRQPIVAHFPMLNFMPKRLKCTVTKIGGLPLNNHLLTHAAPPLVAAGIVFFRGEPLLDSRYCLR